MSTLAERLTVRGHVLEVKEDAPSRNLRSRLMSVRGQSYEATFAKHRGRP